MGGAAGLKRSAPAALLVLAGVAGCGGDLPRGVLPGLDRIANEGAGDLSGRRVGLITNHTGRTRGGRPAAAVLLEAGVEVRALFSPEHGFAGAAAAGEEVASSTDPESGLAVFSLYGADRSPTPESLAGLDALVFDIQDVGVRFYTYIATMRNAQIAAHREGLDFVVLDRPNPNRGDRVEGPMLDPEFRSFVGADRLPLLHGMTVGELARLFAARIGSEVTVVPVANLRRSTRWEDTALPWRSPSPNVPSLETALAYAGFGLFEGTNLSEGRGTAAPFLLVGAPWTDPEAWLERLGGAPDGIRLTPARFVPRPVPAAPSPRFAEEEVVGLRVELADAAAFRPVRSALRVIEAVRATHPESFRFRESRGGYWLDLLLGTDRIRRGLEAGVPARELLDREEAALPAFLEERRPHLLYP